MREKESSRLITIMNKKRKLSTRIYVLPRDICVETTIAALADEGMCFIGQTEEDAKSTAGDLLRYSAIDLLTLSGAELLSVDCLHLSELCRK